MDSQEVVPPSQSETQDRACLFCLLTLAQEAVSSELLQSDRDLEGKAWTTQRGSPSLVLAVALALWAFFFLAHECSVSFSSQHPETKGDTACRHSQMLLTTDGPSNWCLLRMLWARPQGERRGTGGVRHSSSALGSENCMSSWASFSTL